MADLSNSLERILRDRLRQRLEAAFETFEEVPVRHALFRHRRLRADVLAIPRDERFSDIALAFETKGDPDWDKPRWARALKQASDYVLATVEPEVAAHAGKRVMATFVFPAPPWVTGDALDGRGPVDGRAAFLSGMAQMAAFHRVGMAKFSPELQGRPLILSFGPNEVWLSTTGWRSAARDLLVGRRQIGSQRFAILDELRRLDDGR